MPRSVEPTQTPLATPQAADAARWRHQPVTILGLSRTGEAVATYLARLGADVLISDHAPASDATATVRARLHAMGCAMEFGGHTERCVSHAPLLITSPGIAPHAAILQQAAAAGLTVISEVELAARENARQRRLPIVAITGTNGKTTTTTLIAHILNAAGRRTVACGNIGLPMIGCLADETVDTLVVELSSAQLSFSPTFQATVAVFLNLTPDHVSWHGSLAAYAEAKRRLFVGPQAPAWAVMNAEDPTARSWHNDLPSQTLWYARQREAIAGLGPNAVFLDAEGRFILRRQGLETPVGLAASDLPLKGAHNHANVLAAIGACALLPEALLPDVFNSPPPLSLAEIAQACRTFAGVAHRIEPVGVISRGAYRVALYNDSKATNTDAAIQALRALAPHRPILIAGGRPKDEPLQAFVAEVHAHARAVTLLGEAQSRFESALRASGYQDVYPCDTLERALDKALALSCGEPVLFSPACASFDQFQNFEHRGEVFKALVAQRQEAGSP